MFALLNKRVKFAVSRFDSNALVAEIDVRLKFIGHAEKETFE